GGAARIKLNEYNEIAWMLDFNKLLVPTPPVYGKDTNGVNYIISGKDPNRTVPAGIFGSFSDAPGGYREELKEINIATGFEYWYDKQFAFRFGYFHEPATKGNRKFFTLGAGLKYNIFGLDFAYLIPTQQRHPLENTLRFSLLFDLGAQKSSGGDNTGD
nr:PorV/PorQ family protein [Bacteroidota bacterium]